MEIREARRSDWPAVERLIRSSFHPDYRTTTEVHLGVETLEDKLRDMLEEFDASGSRLIGAFEGEKVLGLILARLKAPGRAWVEDIFVAEDARRKGIATELISAACPPDDEVACEVNVKNPG